MHRPAAALARSSKTVGDVAPAEAAAEKFQRFWALGFGYGRRSRYTPATPLPLRSAFVLRISFISHSIAARTGEDSDCCSSPSLTAQGPRFC